MSRRPGSTRHRPRVDQRQAPRDGLSIDVADLELPARRRRRRPPRTTLTLGTGKQSSGRTGPASQNPQPMSELRNPPRKLTPNSATFTRTGLSRPLEDCAGCPALAGVRNLGLDDPSAGCPDSHCNSGDRRIRACRAAAPLSQFPQAGPACFNSEPELPGFSVWSISRRLTLLRHFWCTPGITLSSTPSPRRRFSRGHARRSRWR